MSTTAGSSTYRRTAARAAVGVLVAAVVGVFAVPATALPAASFAEQPGATVSLPALPAEDVAPDPVPNGDVPVDEPEGGGLPAFEAPAVDPDTPPIAYGGAVTAPPAKTLPALVDAIPGYQPSVSCDPNDKPGILAFARLIAGHWGKTRYHTSRQCKLGDGTQHAEGRALDWTLNAYSAGDKALGDTVVAWLSANSGAMARRFGIMYIIWNRRIWYAHRPGASEPYTGPIPHTDHIHFSFTWDGAMARTSWWTGVPVTEPDVGPCRVYAGQYAPRYAGRRTRGCPGHLPQPPYSAYPVTLPGSTGSTVSLAQGLLGVTPIDGSFGSSTLASLLTYQAQTKVPVTGVLDNATWAQLATLMPVPPYRQIVGAPDLTADGWGDVAAVDDAGRLSVFPGTAGGRLGTVRPFGLGWGTMQVFAPGDWNGDRRGDLVAVDEGGDLWLYPGDGRGRFATRRQIGNGWTGYRITPAGDVSGDRVADLLAIDPNGALWLYPGKGTGSFGRRVQVGNGWSSFQLYAAGDQNRDGRGDILGIDPAGILWFYAGRGGGRFSQRVQVGNGWLGYTLASGTDLNRDGISDLVGRDESGTLWLYPGRPGRGYWQRQQLATGW